ncbi:FkbM family methyltransferase [Lacibacter sp.]|uniref:FkbM family methyltransferase n=1 Tax=Lacibacter sp. TaxID=1915409 RepID=UPI002B4AED66|nr:FkbM family methyltransferase [Lacibacter sp.]HLP35719.1 FkbM family methyltransferase [Lacibacter sp.]
MRKIIRKILNRFGYEVIKTDDWYVSKSGKKNVVQVGKYSINMPGNNTLSRTYDIYPDFNSIIGRLAASIAKKYPEMTIVDIGANVGDTIAIVKSVVEVPIIGIEGDEVTYSFLKQNAQQFSNISIINSFLGDKRQELKVELESSGANTTVIPSESGTRVIAFKTLDEVLQEGFNDRVIKLIKLDIEGFDTIVLRGAYERIRKDQPALFFEYNRDVMKAINEDGLSTLLSFTEYGYNKIAFFDYHGRLLLVTSMSNQKEITYLHEYAIGKNNLIGYYDICIFHQQDDLLADEFFDGEAEYCRKNS